MHVFMRYASVHVNRIVRHPEVRFYSLLQHFEECHKFPQRCARHITLGVYARKLSSVDCCRENLKKVAMNISRLDLVFAMDCTGSMGSYIATVQQGIRDIVRVIVARERYDIRLALVEYRDHLPQDDTFVTRVHDFERSVSLMSSWLNAANADGGGDAPEAVADALDKVLKLSWRDEATKVCVFITDAPPHGLNAKGDGFPEGCPDGIDPIHVTTQLAEKGVTMYMVGCEPSITPYKDFFMAIAHMTGGQYVPLEKAESLVKVIIGGVQEEISLQILMEEVNQEVMEEYRISGGVVDEEATTKVVFRKLKEKGAKTKQLKRNNYPLGGPSTSAVILSCKASLSEVKAYYVKYLAPAAPGFGTRLSAYARSAPIGLSYRKSAARFLFRAIGSDYCADECYEVEEDQEITVVQIRRMVKKAVSQNKLPSKEGKRTKNHFWFLALGNISSTTWLFLLLVFFVVHLFLNYFG